MTTANYSVNFSAVLSTTATAVAIGDVGCLDAAGTAYVKATTANKGTRRCSGVFRMAATAGQPSPIQSNGEIPASVTGLAALAGVPTYAVVNAIGRLERSVAPTVSDEVVGTIDEFGNAHVDFSGSFGTAFATAIPAVLFDDSVPGSYSNIVTTRTLTRAIDNTMIGITNLGSDSGAINALGVIANYATCVGGDMPSITAAYAGGGGYRPNARGAGAWAFGLAAFADGEGCFAGGKQNVAGRIPGDPSGEVMYATCFGITNYAQGTASCSIGANNSAQGNYSMCLGFNNSTSVLGIGACAFGNQSTATGTSAFAGGNAQALADGDTAFGSGCVASGSACFAVGYACSATTDGGAVAMGNTSTAASQSACAIGLQCVVTSGARAGIATGNNARCHRPGQYSHSSEAFASVGDAQFCRLTLQGESVNGAAVSLWDFVGDNLVLENGKCYAIRATVIMGRTDVAGRAMYVYDLLAHCTAGAAVIDAGPTASFSAANGEAWTTVIAASGQTLTATLTGTAGHTVRGLVTYQWTEIGGVT
jgi:hypothetical protein